MNSIHSNNLGNSSLYLILNKELKCTLLKKKIENIEKVNSFEYYQKS